MPARASTLAHSDERLTSLTLDVTNAAQIRAAVEKVGSLGILSNNAGVTLYDDLSDRCVVRPLGQAQACDLGAG
jgi:NADP-dependent 3-hydroxy acid dehydrogenase YdfG